MAIADTLNNLLFTGTVGLFKAYGLQLAEDPAGARETNSTYAAVIGFHGAAISGALLLIVDDGLLRASLPTRGTSEREWLGELSNQLLGRVKNRLLAYGVDVAAMVPTVLGSLRVVPSGPRDQRQGISMVADTKERVTVWVDYEIKDAQRLARLARGDAEVGREGDLILF
jgi:hypothetical protein